MRFSRFTVLIPFVSLVGPLWAQNSWRPVSGHIMTRWAEQVTPETAWREHPRPQLVREDWLNLNGLWDYAIVGDSKEWTGGRLENAKADLLLDLAVTEPPQWDGKILVPFSPEAALSGVGKIVRPDQTLWYRRSFTVPAEWSGRRVRLRFEAVDWHAVVFVNGTRIGENKGGYTPFSLDITDALSDSGEQQVTVAVWDPSNAGDQTIGKQSLPEMRRGFRFRPNSGIWQTVWLEPVSQTHIERLKLIPDVDKGAIVVGSTISGGAAGTLRVRVLDGGEEIATGEGPSGDPLAVTIPSPKLWSPEAPFLYDLEAELLREGSSVDLVKSYFGMRKIAIQADENGIPRFFLNNKLLTFQLGPLDQGYWPDGLLTPPSDAAAEFDIQYLKDIAANMIRVHIKVHPDRWYYHCDRLGIIVWQDMVCSRKFESKITAASAKQWELEQRRMIDHLHNHPSIIQWVVFNEGWGQYDTERLTAWTKAYDPTRLVTGVSGFMDVPGVGDISDVHDYSFYPTIRTHELGEERAVVLGEFGGFNVLVEGELWHEDQKQETKTDPTAEAGREAYGAVDMWLPNYKRWLDGFRYLIAGHGLNAGVYTQISDVEHEINGWLTYDRSRSKIDQATLRALHEPLYETPATYKIIVPTARTGKSAWRWYAKQDKPKLEVPEGWQEPAFEDSKWLAGSAPFGSVAAEAASVISSDAEELFLRKVARIEELPRRPALLAYSTPCEAEVYVNGKRVMTFNSYRTVERGVSIVPLPANAVAAFREGLNHLAVRVTFIPPYPKTVRDPGDATFFDLGVVDLQ